MKATITRLHVAGIRHVQDELAQAPWITGYLMMDDWITNNTYFRPMRVARFHPERTFNFHPQLLAHLFDVRVLLITETQRFISGIENVAEGKQTREGAQTRLVNVS